MILVLVLARGVPSDMDDLWTQMDEVDDHRDEASLVEIDESGVTNEFVKRERSLSSFNWF